MSFTYTPNYNLAKPAENTYDWGDEINANFDTIDAALKALSDALTNHTNRIDNPHQVTYVQTGAASAVHTHPGSDITSPVLEAVLADKVDNIHLRTEDNLLYFSTDNINWIVAGEMTKAVYDANNNGVVDNAEKVGGYSPSTTATADTVAVRDSNGDLTARVLKSSATTGTAPISVTSTTVCTNLNADMVDGYDASAFASASHNHDSTYIRKATADTITAVHTFNPSSAGAPFTLGTNAQGQLVAGLNADKVDGYDVGNSSGQVPVSNGTLCTNLNADMLDGQHASAFASASHNHDSTYIRKATADTITAVHTFNPSSAGAPFTLGTNAQGQLVAGLNADKVDGYDVGNSSGQVPVSNGTLCTNLNADKVDSLHFSVSSNQLRFSQDGSNWRMVRVTYVSTNAPSSNDGMDGDVWLKYQ